MKKTIRWSWLRDISIAKKLYFIVGTMAILIVIELLTLWFAIHTLSSVRAFIGAEGLWSKAQKDGVFHLGKYQRSHNEADYIAFKKFMEVPLGDHKARVELFKKDPDLSIVKAGFLQGRIHPDDMDGMIKLVTRFNNTHYIHKALDYWGQGDSLITVLIPIAEETQRQIHSGSISSEKLDQLTQGVDAINEQLTHLEDNFSFTLEEGSRWLENLILKILFTVALTVEITGLVLTVLVTRSITKGLNEINRVSDKIMKGHLDEQVTVFSNDEIGQVATSVNRMTEQLIISNRELQNFAHIASHDLQEPLRKIIVFTDLLNEEAGTAVSEKGKQYMLRITDAASRMQRLVEDVLQLAGVNSSMEFTRVDLNNTISRIVSDMEITISKANASVIVGRMPEIEANEIQMEQLFQNLIGNALKFTSSNPVINISAEMISDRELPEDYRGKNLHGPAAKEKANDLTSGFCRIYVKDNGIGFDEVYLDRIFTAFQRLHSKQKYQGTGIGLAICQKIVQNHHGMISAVSTAGQGATFIVTLPLLQKQFKNAVNI
ncbi:MAG: ATP-binding protein [Ferruginibacter sp.]